MRLLLLPLLLLATACSAKEPAPGPALWKVADGDTTIYLFGTIHALPTGAAWRDARIAAALAASQELVLETIVDRTGGGTAQTLIQMGTDEPEPPLAERVPAEKRAALAAMVGRSGFPAAVMDRLESWAAGFVLTSVAIREIGLDGANGVEEQLSTEFRAAGKPITGLETVPQQLGYFDDLAEADQRRFLVETLDDPETGRKDYEAMLAAWRAGDPAAIARTFDEDMKETPALRRVLLVERNRRWADWVRARLGKPGAVFVAVGAGHLAGPDSVVGMLEAAGLRVERVR